MPQFCQREGPLSDQYSYVQWMTRYTAVSVTATTEGTRNKYPLRAAEERFPSMYTVNDPNTYTSINKRSSPRGNINMPLYSKEFLQLGATNSIQYHKVGYISACCPAIVPPLSPSYHGKPRYLGPPYIGPPTVVLRYLCLTWN